MTKNAVKNFLIPCFIFDVSTNLYAWLMKSFYLQKIKKAYEVDHVSKGK